MPGPWVVSHLFRCAITGCPLPLFGSPASVRDYLHVDDVAGVVADLLRLDDVPWPLNVGTGLGHTVKEVADIITGVTTLPIAIEPLQERMFDVANNGSRLFGAGRAHGVPGHPADRRTRADLVRAQQAPAHRYLAQGVGALADGGFLTAWDEHAAFWRRQRYRQVALFRRPAE